MFYHLLRDLSQVEAEAIVYKLEAHRLSPQASLPCPHEGQSEAKTPKLTLLFSPLNVSVAVSLTFPCKSFTASSQGHSLTFLRQLGLHKCPSSLQRHNPNMHIFLDYSPFPPPALAHRYSTPAQGAAGCWAGWMLGRRSLMTSAH